MEFPIDSMGCIKPFKLFFTQNIFTVDSINTFLILKYISPQRISSMNLRYKIFHMMQRNAM